MAEGRKDFTAGDVLTAAQVDDYLMLQSVMRFADASARDSALASVLTEGLHAYLKDTNTLTVYDGSAWVTKNQLAALSSWSPTITQSGTVTKTDDYCKYTRSGRLITAWFQVTFSGTGATNSAITSTLPVTAATGGSQPIGSGVFGDISASTFAPFIIILTATTTMNFIDTTQSTAGPVLGQTGTLFAGALASGDTLAGHITYEAASSS